MKTRGQRRLVAEVPAQRYHDHALVLTRQSLQDRLGAVIGPVVYVVDDRFGRESPESLH
jgi:hypothetical protein